MGIDRLLERIARFFRLNPTPYDPQEQTRHEAPGAWLFACLAAWLMMLSCLAATAVVFPDLPLLLEMSIIMLVAFPVAYRLHYLRTSRLLVNWLTFTTALILGIIQLRVFWPRSDAMYAANVADAMVFLVLCFMWITAFRAFSLRTINDLVQTILPCGSIILLVLILNPNPLVLGTTALVVLGALVVLSIEHRTGLATTLHSVSTVTGTRGSRAAGTLYSWPSLYALVIAAALVVAYGAATLELSGGVGNQLRVVMINHVLRWISPQERSVMPVNAMPVGRMDSWPDSDVPVYSVRTSHPGNMRIQVFHEYTGQWWRTDDRPKMPAVNDGGWQRIPMTGAGASEDQATEVEQVVTVHKTIMAHIPSAFCPVAIEVGDRQVRYNQPRLLQVTKYIDSGEIYTVVSQLPPLIPLSGRSGVKYDTDLLEADLQLPDNLPQRIIRLAEQIVGDETDPVTRARLIEQHLLWGGYTYSLSVQPSWPNDFVDFFLFEGKTGFCQHFASAMVVMCRAVGIPARLVTGFNRGEEDPDDPDLYMVRELNAHAWAEVYIAGAGWLEFDPTPAGEEEESILAQAWDDINEGVRAFALSVGRFGAKYWYVPLAVIILLPFAVIVMRSHSDRRFLRRRGIEGDLGRIVGAYLRTRRLIASRGAPDTPSLAPREFLRGAPPLSDEVRRDIETLIEWYVAARFGHRPVDDAAVKDAEALSRRIASRLREDERAARSGNEEPGIGNG